MALSERPDVPYSGRMEHAASTFLRWAGRILILLGVFVLAASLFLPDAVAPLSPVVCPDGTDLSNTRYTNPNAPSNEDMEVVCTSREYTESALVKVLVVAGGLAALGLIAIWASTWVGRSGTRLPDVPAAR